MLKQVASNVYFGHSQVESFENSAEIPENSFRDIGKYIADVYGYEPAGVKWLDAGCGTGRTIVNMVSGFAPVCPISECLGFDVSSEMLEKFRQRMAKQSLRGIDFLLADANDCNEANDPLPASRFDIVSIISVLHYLTDWKGFLTYCNNKLSDNGIIVQAELLGWYRLLDGTIEPQNPVPQLDREFWQVYFAERSKIAPWPPEVCFSNLSQANKFCREELGMVPLSQHDFIWNWSFNWNSVLSWIEVGPLSSLGSNIENPSERVYLADFMRNFLKKKSANLDTPFSIEWGFRVFIFCKHQKGDAK